MDVGPPPERPPDPEAQPKSFRRKIALAKGAGPTDPEAGPTAGAGRKRRWGSVMGGAGRRSLSISTDSLKSLVPGLRAEAVLELHPPEDAPISEEEEGGGGPGGAPIATQGGGGAHEATPPPREPPLKICRTVTQVVPAEATENGGGGAEGGGASAEGAEPKQQAPPAGPAPSSGPAPSGAGGEEEPKGRRSVAQQRRGVTVTIDDPVRAAPRPSPPRARPTPIVHLCNLVRPFTLGQLKALLGRTGTLREDGFWIDRIKSHCYVTYASVEEAAATREALHGVRWPQSNPKVLAADFAEQEELDFHRGLSLDGAGTWAGPGGGGGGAAGAVGGTSGGPAVGGASQGACPRGSGAGLREGAGLRAERERALARRERARGEREWDRDKGAGPAPSPAPAQPGHAPSPGGSAPASGGGSAHRDSRPRPSRGGGGGERGRPREQRPEKREKAPEEPPAKLLDDLFRKTKAAPCIYWLPLTDSQFTQKQAERQARARERERRRKEQEEAELRARSGRGHDKRGGASSRDRPSGGGATQPSANQSATPGPAPRSKRRSRSRSTPLRDHL